jgi:hydroxyacylglutathione hydrolase
MLGATKLKFLSTPGHTPGQGCWYNFDKMTDIIVGDTLFAGSIGRTDFPMSNRDDMKDSLRRLLKLPGGMFVHSGHGRVTTLGQELETNPFLGYLRQERGMAVGNTLRW